MSLVLAIETSSSEYFIALGDKGEMIYHSAEIEGLNKDKDLGLLLRTGLDLARRDIKEIDVISINIGPGGLGAVRSGVSFANGLSFGLGKPLLCLNAFELCGFEAAKFHDLPVVCTANAADGKAYAALYENGNLSKLRYGPLVEIAEEVTQGLTQCCLTGTHQDRMPEILKDINCIKTDIRFASAPSQLDYIATHDIDARLSLEPASPVNEHSRIFQEKESAT